MTQGEASPSETVASDERPSSEPTEAPTTATEAVEEERICRRIRTDMASRRATKVCLTREEWREFNQHR